MNIILLSKSNRQIRTINLHSGVALFLVSLVVALTCGLAGYSIAGYQTQVATASDGEVEYSLVIEQQAIVDKAVRESRDAVNALNSKVAEIQAKAIRVDALGKRLVDLARLEKGEFDFDSVPAQGGPSGALLAEEVEVVDFIKSLTRLSRQLKDREEQLWVLETLLLNKTLKDEAMPAGRPVRSGWLSSPFGKRTDPFTGKKASHDGVDFAGKMGSDVLVVAGGIVTWSGDRYGYGKMVEVDHGNGYVTRYGHNKENLVGVGATVKKGQVIALMGSSGRSTGPHVHFEVLHQGRPVNPEKYVWVKR
ncbi:MAG: M23 family metallopeptidase [Gammaproteobacteria bacterium]|nr:M23 family metallopeptidase [Gammaproteobacteria bacterium]